MRKEGEVCQWGVTVEVVVVDFIIEIVPRYGQAPACQARVAGIGDDPLQPDEEEDYAEHYSRAIVHDQPAEYCNPFVLSS